MKSPVKQYLYPDGKTRDKSLTELSPEEMEAAMTPRHMTVSEIRKRKWIQQKATIKAVLLIPYELFLVVLTALILLPDALIKQWKEDK